MSVNPVRAQQLSEIDHELGRCVEDATRWRDVLIRLSSFPDADELVRLDEIDISAALAALLKCRNRARELLAARKKVAAL